MSATMIRIEQWPELMTSKTAALYLDCSERSVERLQEQGHLIPVKGPGGKRFPRKEIDAYISSLSEWDAAKPE